MRIAILGLMLAATAAHADTHEDTATVQLGGLLTSDGQQGFVAAELEASVHLAQTPLWAHAGVAIGSPLQFSLGGDLGDQVDVSGELRQLVGGVEARGCMAPAVCGIAGLDAGYRSIAYEQNDGTNPSSSTSASARGLVAIPRLQLDVGTDRVRVRPGLAVPISAGAPAMQLSIALAVLL